MSTPFDHHFSPWMGRKSHRPVPGVQWPESVVVAEVRRVQSFVTDFGLESYLYPFFVTMSRYTKRRWHYRGLPNTLQTLVGDLLQIFTLRVLYRYLVFVNNDRTKMVLTCVTKRNYFETRSRIRLKKTMFMCLKWRKNQSRTILKKRT